MTEKWAVQLEYSVKPCLECFTGSKKAFDIARPLVRSVLAVGNKHHEAAAKFHELTDFVRPSGPI